MGVGRGNAEVPLTSRLSSSVPMLAERVRQVGRAYAARDEPALRAELKALSREAALLAVVYPLLPRP